MHPRSPDSRCTAARFFAPLRGLVALLGIALLTCAAGAQTTLQIEDSVQTYESLSSTYLGQLRVNGATAVHGGNVRIVQFGMGTVVTPFTNAEQPLETFTEPRFAGASKTYGLYTYYNTASALGTMQGDISSFKLKRGFMATFATQANGSGTSKVYVAQDHDVLNAAWHPVEDAYTSLNNGSVDAAIAAWPELLATGLRVGSPAVTDGGKSWLYSFMDKANAAGLRVDYIAIHNYQCGNSAASLKSWLQDIWDRYRKPIWITEFNNGANWTNCGDPAHRARFLRLKASR